MAYTPGGPGAFRSTMKSQNWRFDDWSPGFRRSLKERGHVGTGYVDNHVPGSMIKGEFMERNRRRATLPPTSFYGSGSKYHGRGLYGAMPDPRQPFLMPMPRARNAGVRQGRGVMKGLYRGYQPEVGYFRPRTTARRSPRPRARYRGGPMPLRAVRGRSPLPYNFSTPRRR